ncbi:MAG: multicopper oxidase domain-containing protein [Gemmatimonadales bacterium]
MLRAVVLLAIAAGICEGQQRPCDPQTPVGPSHDLYCLELVPAPGVSGVSGRIELSIPPGPFTVAVTPDGRTRFLPQITITGLAAGRRYDAWVASPLMDTVIRLGSVHNGMTTLPIVDLEKFFFLIKDRSGRVMLRGQSPSTRLFPPDLLEFSAGAVGQGSGVEHQHDMSGWPMVPVPAGLTMLPAEMALRPAIAPFLPDSMPPAPDARPSEVMHLKSGDTLRLQAGLVRRTLQGRTYTMYGYNGQYPGPLLEAAPGADIVVRFSNALPESSSIHWHGIRVDNASDGVEPVAHEFIYHLRVPDAGIYWYHPHVREDTQQELGLYGNILVRTEYGPVNREEVLILDDVLVGDDGLIPLARSLPRMRSWDGSGICFW